MKYLLIFLLIISDTYSAELFFPGLKTETLQKKTEACEKKHQSPEIPKDLYIKADKVLLEKLTVKSKKDADARSEFVLCVIRNSLSSEEKEELLNSLEFYAVRQKQYLEYNSRFLYSMEKENILKFGELKIMQEYIRSKNDLYILLLKADREIILDKTEQTDYENEIRNIHYSLAYLNYEFFLSLNPKTRKTIVERLY